MFTWFHYKLVVYFESTNSGGANTQIQVKFLLHNKRLLMYIEKYYENLISFHIGIKFLTSHLSEAGVLAGEVNQVWNI